MHQLNTDDTVRFEGQGKVHYGLVRNVGKRFAVVYDLSTSEEKKIALSRLTYIPPVILGPEQLGRLCRFEISWSELTCGAPDHANVAFTQPFAITLDDIKTGLQNIRRSLTDNNTLSEEWFEPIYSHYCIYTDIFIDEKTPESVEYVPGLPDRGRKLAEIFVIIEKIFQNNIPLRNAAPGIVREIDRYFEDEKKPVTQRRYTDSEKESFLVYYDCICGEGNIRTADDLTRSIYKSFVEELCPKGNKLAMKIKCKNCLHGSELFEKDPEEAYKYLKILFSLTGDPYYALDLGDIYYSGACSDGTPDYDEAFRNYSIAAATGIFDARSKIAKMFANGQGVPMNKDVAWKIIEELYAVCERRFLMGDYDCKFAEAAYTRGRAVLDGNAGFNNQELAFESLLQAQLALSLRKQLGGRSDDRLADMIHQDIDSLLFGWPPRSKTARIWTNSLLSHHLHKYRRMIMRIRRLKNGDLKLTFSIEKFPDEHSRPLMLITETETGFCDLTGSVTLKVCGSSLKSIPEEPVFFNATDGQNYYLGGSRVITVDGTYIFSPKA